MRSDEAKIFIAQEKPRRWRVLWVYVLALTLVALSFFFTRSGKEPVQSAEPIHSPTLPQATVSPPAPIPATMAAAPVDPDHARRIAIAAMDEHLLLHLPLSSSLDDHSPRRLAVVPSGNIEIHDGVAHFPGDAYLQLPHIPLNNRAFSFSVWIKPEGIVAGYGLLEQVDGGKHKHLHILMRDPDKPYFGFYLDDLRATQSITQDSGWTHLTFQFTGRQQQIWINGELSIERPSDAYQGERGETRIGKAPMWNNVPTQCFTGSMRDLRLYDTALTPAQIRLLAGFEATVSTPPPEPKKKTIEQF